MTATYQAQLEAKIQRISTQFAEFNPPALEVFESPCLLYTSDAADE